MSVSWRDSAAREPHADGRRRALPARTCDYSDRTNPYRSNQNVTRRVRLDSGMFIRSAQGTPNSSRFTRTASEEANVKLLGNDALGSAVMSAVAGYVDTVGVLALFGLFTAHITGNLVTFGTTITGAASTSSNNRLVMLPVFIGSVALTTLFARAMKRRGIPTLPSLLSLMTLSLAMFCVVGEALRPFANRPDTWATLVIGGASVSAMGVQNTLMRNGLGGYSPTTIMTGNLTQCTIEIVNLISSHKAWGERRHQLERQASLGNLKRFGAPLLGFIVGTAAGAWLTRQFGLISVWAPTLTMAGMSSHAWYATLRRRSIATVYAVRSFVPIHRCSVGAEGECRLRVAPVAALSSRFVSSNPESASKNSGTFARAGSTEKAG